MNRWLSASLSVALAVATAPGQQNETPPPGGNRVERRAEEMRNNLGNAKTVKSHVRVQVRLKNGNRLRGVVKDGKLVERVNGLRFVDAEATDRGAGIRLWYSGGARNYVFVPFKALARYTVLERLTAKELVAIEDKMKRDETRRAEQRRQLLAAEAAKKAAAAAAVAAARPGGEGKAGGPVAGSPATGGPAGQPAPTKKPVVTEDSPAVKQQKAWFQLLQQYPPAQGWNEAKRDEIKRRFAVIGARPTKHEQNFVDNYAEWLKACKQFGMEPAPATGNEPGKRGRRKK